MDGHKKTIAREISEYEELRQRVLAALNGLRNAPRTKRALKRHLRLVESTLAMLERDLGGRMPRVHPQEPSNPSSRSKPDILEPNE